MRRFFLKLFRRPKLHADLDAELAFHREMAAAHGNPLGLGNTTMVREHALDLWRFTLLEDLARDLLYAIRGARRSPGFILTALLSLALGIGANTAIFSLMNAVVLRTLPVDKPDELEQITVYNGKNSVNVFSYPNFRDLRRDNTVFSELFARSASPASLVAGGRTDRGVVEVVSGNYFPALGVRPILGRTITDDDDRVPMAHPVTVVGYRYWRDSLGADRAIVGQTIRIDDHPFTIIGVAPPAFYGVEVGTIVDVWVPMMMQPAVFGGGHPSFDDANWGWILLFGRRAPGVSQARAQAGLQVTLLQLLARDKQFRGNGFAIILKPAGAGLSRLRATFESPLTVLMVIVALVLLIACANLANLLLARSASRNREIAVRLALGAGRGRLVRQLLTESSLLGLAGGLLGVVASAWGVRALLRFLPAERIPMELDVHLDWRVLAFAAGLSLTTALMFGLAPALQATRPGVSDALKGAGIWRQSLVIVQVAISLLLLVGAGLFLQSLRNVATLRIGLDTDNVLMASMNPALSGYALPQIANFYRQLEARAREIPGVRAVGLSESAVLSGDWSGVGLQVPGQAPPSGGNGILLNKVGGDFFRTAGIAILRGRDFGPSDTQDSPTGAIITESAARYYFPDSEAVGRDVVLARAPTRIIGIAADSKYRSVREDTPRIAYLSFQQERSPSRERTIYLRTAGDPALLAAALRGAIREMDRNLPIYGLKTFAEQKAESLTSERLIATLSGFFGLLALLLAATGLYGVLAYLVERRTREIGIRMSLGAGRDQVLWMVLRGALAMAAAGLAVGAPLSRWLSTLVEKQLFGIRPGDVATLAAACAILAAVVVAAAAIPAWRASRVDPIIALRYE
jgi:predicted permease